MFKTRKIAGLSVALMLIGAPLMAQTSAAPQQEQQTTEIADADLQKFADAYTEIQLENKNAQEQMVAIVEEEGLDVQRFGEIQQASMDPNSTLEVSDEEKAKHESANKKLKKVQDGFKQKVEGIIVSNGLTMDRFDQIFAAIQNDKELQQKVQGMLMKG